MRGPASYICLRDLLKGEGMSSILIPVVVFISLINPLFAQTWIQNDVIFNPSGIPSLPFSQPRFADLDGDGDMDMILGSTSGSLQFFKNTGSKSTLGFISWDGTPGNIQALDAELGVCGDLDADGDLDLVTGGYTGLNLYTNFGDTRAPFFVKSPGMFSEVNSTVNPVPHFADMDADDDLDMILGLSESGAVIYYENLGSPDSALFRQSASSQWFDVGLYAYPWFSDMDSDGDYDVLIGRDGHGLRFYLNEGDAGAWSWTDRSAQFDNLGQSTYWNSPCLVDLNGDGKQDLVHGTASGPLRYYRNTGSLAQPSWTEDKSLFGGVLDVGGASTPVFIDFDTDGDLDLLSGSTLGEIKYYENIGSRHAPAWSADHSYFASIDHSIYSAVTAGDMNGDGLLDLIVGDLSGKLYYHQNTGNGFIFSSSTFSGISVDGFSSPRLYDLDNDLDLDLIIGAEGGELGYYENTGSAGNPIWSVDTALFKGIDVGSNATVTFGYVDANASLDMISGNLFRELQFFSLEDGIWVEHANKLADLTTGQNATPALVDLDGDTDLDLVVGNYDGTFNYFMNKTIVEAHKEKLLPLSYGLQSVYPNPFNPTTTIRFSVNQTANIKVAIIDLRGREIKMLLQASLTAGEYDLDWDGKNHGDNLVPSGVYFLVFSDGLHTQTRKVTYLR